MGERCTSSGDCTAGYADCVPCPFTDADLWSGDMAALTTPISTVLSEAWASGAEVIDGMVSKLVEVGDIIGVDEADKVRKAVEARLI